MNEIVKAIREGFSARSPDTLKLREYLNLAHGHLAEGRWPDPSEIASIVRSVQADSSHPFWDASHPEHKDAVEFVADLQSFSAAARGVDIDTSTQEFSDTYVTD